MKIYKDIEQNLVKMDEASNTSGVIEESGVKDFLEKNKLKLPQTLSRGDIFYALLPLRTGAGKKCKPHPVLVIQDFGLDYSKFAELENGEYKSNVFNTQMPPMKSFWDNFSKGEEPMVLVYILTSTLIDSSCLGLDARNKPIAPIVKFPLPYYKADNLNKFCYIELFKSPETYNGPLKSFAPLLISKRSLCYEAGVRGGRARLDRMDRFLFSKMIIDDINWEQQGDLNTVLKGNTKPVGKCLIEPKDFANDGFNNDTSYQKEVITYVRNKLRTNSGKEEKVTVTIPVIEDLKRSIIMAKYRYLFKEEEDLFPCWPDDCWGKLKKASEEDENGNPDIASTNKSLQKNKYFSEIKFEKPEEEEFKKYQANGYIPKDIKYKDILDKKVEYIYDISFSPRKLVQSFVFDAEKNRKCLFPRGVPSLIAWIPEEWTDKARKEREEEKRRREEEEKRKEEERRKKEEEEKNKKIKIKKVIKKTPIIVKVKNSNTSSNPIPNKSLLDDNQSALTEEDLEKTEESFEDKYSYKELREFIEHYLN